MCSAQQLLSRQTPTLRPKSDLLVSVSLRLVLFVYIGLGSIHGANAQSVLQTGTWYKIGVLGTGVYQLDYATLTALDPAFKTADPRTFRLYGNGGAPLPQANAMPRPVDLLENAIQVTGEDDGRFDTGDVVRFYAQGPQTITRDTLTGRFTHQLNPYTDTTFYFLTISPGVGRRIVTRQPGAAIGLPTITTFDHYAYYEHDTTNLINSGRDWIGDYYGTYPQQFVPFQLPGRVDGSPTYITLSAVGISLSPSVFYVSLDNTILTSATFNAISGYEFTARGSAKTVTGQAVLPTAPDELRLTMTYDRQSGSGAVAYLNYVAVQTRREIRQYDVPTLVRGSRGSYTAKQATNDLLIWDVANPISPVQQAYTLSGTQATWTASDTAAFYLYTNRTISAPVAAYAIPNQNIRAEATPNLLIITPAAWRDQAERLAAFRRANDKLTVLVATTAQVYNEFSSGQPDVSAIRDIARFFARKQPGTLHYLLLVGDASYDYRGKTKSLTPAQMANLIPTYESRESLHPVFSFSSDDYFGFLKDTDGEWPETDTDSTRLDIGVGRLAVKTPAEARSVVDKLIRYASDKRLLGDWRTKILLVADDGDGNIHQNDEDRLAALIEARHPEFRPERLFLDTFKQDTIVLPGQPPNLVTERAPTVNQAINRAIDEGRLLINYAGHGGENGWAQEQILTVQDILSWTNSRMPLFITATCQFGRYDNPNVVSGAELAQVDRAGGAIGLLTTTRPVYANTNYLLNDAFYKAIFLAVEGGLPRLGDVMRATKNNSISGVQNRNFTLLGDPSMRLAYPQQNVTFTRLNDKALKPEQVDTLRAGQRILLQGEVRPQSSTLAVGSFTGTVRVMVYDKPVSLKTHGTESGPFSYKAYQSLLFAGQAEVQQGRFQISFNVPTDVLPTFGFGRVYAYAVQTDSLSDAVGGYQNLVIGGTGTLPADTRPPTLTLTLAGADPSAKQPSVAGATATIHIRVADETGINLTQTTANHGPTLQVDAATPVRIADYFTGSADGRTGEFTFPLRDMAPGNYVVRARVYDLNNNLAEATLAFVVSDRPAMTIQRLVGAPNPVREQSQWLLTHNRPGQPLTWTWRILSMSGKSLIEQRGECYDCSETVTIGSYDRLTFPLATGIYILQAELTNPETGEHAKATNRLLFAD
ncbi:type IX secretion system sortase PorU [Fibrella forsythiae]|uniref:Type IX secretion system sortase PorU n=1 Tax=Fibrella forsythiae TaxID=2817061 RepID=A0ABS3JIU4_9BACT|nr:type IX secretion system sortase PorU [Fibrella forsythiae]MBO0949928.1 type IX secretion system sortase PorU [Fibrella forsythiae]